MNKNLSLLSAASLLLVATHLPAQTSGTSHPEALDDSITTASAPVKPAKPSPDVPLATSAPALHQHDAPPAPVIVASSTPAEAPAPIVRNQNLVVTDDINSGIVTEAYSPDNEVPEGTLFHVKLDGDISTVTTARGAAFHAQLVNPIQRHGVILVPAGAMLSGRVSALHGGRRISGSATIHLEPEFITLPDGTSYKVQAQVIDLAHMRGSHVSSEGTIIGNDHTKGEMAALGLTTASTPVAGAVLGGGVGAVVGLGVGVTAGSIFWLRHENQQTLPQGTELILSLNQPMLLQNVAN